MASELNGYPVHFEVARSERQSRLTNFPLGIGTFIREILLIPHLIVIYFLSLVASLIFFIAGFAILFSGRYPRGMFDFYVGVLRWTYNVYGYFGHLYDKYPPFSTEAQEYPLTFTVDYPEHLSRLLNLPLFIGPLIKSILVIPHYVILLFLGIAAVIVIFIAEFAILFTGAFPAGLHGFVAGVGRWYVRVAAYPAALTDKYPPFSLS